MFERMLGMWGLIFALSLPPVIIYAMAKDVLCKMENVLSNNILMIELTPIGIALVFGIPWAILLSKLFKKQIDWLLWGKTE